MTKRKRTGRADAVAPIEKDAEGQFARLRGANSNSGVSSAAPRVLTGDEDATFDTDPGDRALGTLEDQRRPKPGEGRRS